MSVANFKKLGFLCISFQSWVNLKLPKVWPIFPQTTSVGFQKTEASALNIDKDRRISALLTHCCTWFSKCWLKDEMCHSTFRFYYVAHELEHVNTYISIIKVLKLTKVVSYIFLTVSKRSWQTVAQKHRWLRSCSLYHRRWLQ